ncbi:MAG TPA: hexitol phosphatase HxpB [Chitinophagales bacterium]|nr:hexitol phosphatase HxpB [Chitinophagales bacterium]
MLQNFDLVIYDMDGLLIDSEPFWRKAEIKVFATVGLHLTDDDCKQTTGFRFDEVVEYWWRRAPWHGKTKEQIHDEVIDAMEGYIRQEAVGMKGAVASLGYFKSKGMPLALASSSAMRLIKATVERLEIEEYFRLLVSAEHERYGKPHPAVFLRTAETLNIRPEKCLVIEDSLNGVLAAKAAKMQCVAVPDPPQFNDPRFAIADWKLQNLEQISSLF